MWKAEKWIQSAIGALIGTVIISFFTGSWALFLVDWLFSIPFTRILSTILFERKRKGERDKKLEIERQKVRPFKPLEYYDRIEKASLEILEAKEPTEKIIILWWGMNGLRMNEDGNLEWISRKKPESGNHNVLYHPCQTVRPMPQYDMCQSTQATIGQLQAQNVALQLQAAQSAQNAAIIATLHSYPSYLYKAGGSGGTGGAGYLQTTYCPQMQSPYFMHQ